MDNFCRFAAGVALLSLVAGVDSKAEELQFAIESSRSQLTLSGTYLGLALQAQDPLGASGRTSATGFITVDVDDAAAPSVLEVNDSSLQFNDSGDWLPETLGGLAPGQPGLPTSANFALWVDAGEMGRGWGAIRDLVLHFEAESIRMTDFLFAAPSMFATDAGVFEYNVDVIGNQFKGQTILSSSTDENRPASRAMWQLTDAGATLVIPILVSTLTELDLVMEGQLIATTDLPWRRGDFDADTFLTSSDIDALARAIRDAQAPRRFDLNLDGHVDRDDFIMWVEIRRETYLGDADLNGRFDSSDLVSVLTAGQYEDEFIGNSTWATGDWTADGEFTSGDFVAALQAGGYEQGPRVMEAVPEPAVIALWELFGVMMALKSHGFRRFAKR